MTDNQIINGVIGECDCLGAGIKCRIVCRGKQYDINPAAWDAKLYQWIEEQGLVMSYLRFLDSTVHPNDIDTSLLMGWYRHKATPAQKASALAQAIKERDQ